MTIKEKNKGVTDYIGDASDLSKPVLNHLRNLVHQVVPDVEEKMAWGFCNFYYKGKGMIFMKSLKSRVSFGFWNDRQVFVSPKISKEALAINEPLVNLTQFSDLPKDSLIIECINIAVENIDGGVKPIKKVKPKKTLIIPDYITKELDKNKAAKSNFDKMSPSHKKEYIEWVESAKTEDTKNRRIIQMTEMLVEGKSKNWKYQKT